MQILRKRLEEKDESLRLPSVDLKSILESVV